MTSETHTEPKVNPDSLKETNAEEWQYLDEVEGARTALLFEKQIIIRMG